MSPASSLPSAHEPVLDSACKQLLRVAVPEARDQHRVHPSVLGAQFFSRILVRSSFSRFTIGLGSSFSPAAIMAFS